MSGAGAALPLEGVLVADFSRVLAGPYATQALADLGARVIKVERPGSGDDTRGWGPPWTESSSAYFECANRTKESVTLDLRDEHDKQLALELVRRADVLVENFRPGALDRLGLGWEQLHELNPRLVYCSITGFGRHEGASLPGYDFVVQASGGLMSITGAPDGEPTKAGVALVDVLTGKDAAFGIMAALRERDRSGLGQRVEVNLLSSLLGALVNQTSSYLTTGRAPARMGNQHPSIAPYETLHCADGLVAVACGNDGQFARLADVVGRCDLATDERFATNAARVVNRPALVDALEQALGAASVAHWVEALSAVGVPAGEVRDVGAAIRFADSLGLDPVVGMGEGHPGQVRHAVTYSRTQVRPPQAPPALGEHDAQLRAWLADVDD